MKISWQRGHFPNSDCCTEVENISSDHPHPPDPAAFPSPQTCFATKLGRHHSAGGESTEGGDSEICRSANPLFKRVCSTFRILGKVYIIWYRILSLICSVPFWSFWPHCIGTANFCIVSSYIFSSNLNHFHFSLWYHSWRKFYIRAAALPKTDFSRKNFKSGSIIKLRFHFGIHSPPYPPFRGLTRGLVSTQWHA